MLNFLKINFLLKTQRVGLKIDLAPGSDGFFPLPFIYSPIIVKFGNLRGNTKKYL
jgi:hypothetical protein